MTAPPPPDPWLPRAPGRPAITPDPGGAPSSDQGWWDLFDETAFAKPPPVRRFRSPRLIGIGAVSAMLLVIGVVWLTRSPANQATTATPSVAVQPGTTAAPPSVPTEPALVPLAPDRQLASALPQGYPPGACSAESASDGVRAATACSRNTDRDGPASARYSVASDPMALQRAFDRGASELKLVVCPGNIQSPGPWRRNATPDRVSGTLMCGTRGGVPVVAWTNDDALLLGVVFGDPRGPDLAGLYRWWSSHS